MISSLQHPLVKHLVKLRENKKYRMLHQATIVSGWTLIKEISNYLRPNKIYTENLDENLELAEQIIVSHPVLKKITGLPSPEPIAAEFPLPSPTNLFHRYPILALDAIRDPGNLGTLIRTALSFDWQGLFLLPTCVDIFNEKVIRASRGAVFRLPWYIGSWDELSHLKTEQKLTAYIADLQGKDISTVLTNEKILLLMSNESQGVSPQGADLGEKVTISMKGVMESLNVASAGAILMYLLRQT